MLVAIAISLAIGGIVGFVIARRMSVSPAQPAPTSRDTDAGAGSAVLDGTLREAIDQLELGVVVGDPAGTIVYRNRAATALAGTHVGVLVDDHVDHVLERARRGEKLQDALDVHGPPRLALLFGAEPMPGGFALATIEDVSERQRIDSMRTDFVANISHELKTPVGAIAVLSEALLGERDPVVVERLASRMVEEAHRAVGSIDDLLELSTIESAPRRDEDVALADIVSAAITRGRVADESRHVTVTSIDASDDLVLRADERQLVSALGNLVENAVKYSDDGGLVQVRTRRDADAVEIMVADQGDGVPARDLDRIFERFYRVDRARSRETGGTGLGLAIVRHVASNHGGEVSVSSTEGEGSTFVLRLPASLIVEGSDVAHTEEQHT